MTNLTPQQMRELAYEGDERALEMLTRSPGAMYTLTAALRTAADQLEALDIVSRNRSAVPYETIRGILTSDAILTADTAPGLSDD